jgi:hypothetical protein
MSFDRGFAKIETEIERLQPWFVESIRPEVGIQP